MPRASERRPTPAAPGVRVVFDARPMQDPERAPTTAAYAASLLAAFERTPVDGESFAFLLRSDRPDPTADLDGLSVIGRRLLPPTGPLRAAAPTIDPLVLRGASLGAAWRAERGGAHGAVYHTIGAGMLPIGSGLPVVATLLDLAAWELPDTFREAGLARFGLRLRRRLIRDAAAVIVGTDAVARAAVRRLRVRPERVHLVPIAPRAAYVGTADEPVVDDAARLGLGARYLVWPGRYDARQDLGTLFAALARLAAAGRPSGLPADVAWPPRVVLVGAPPDDRAAIARAAARHDVGEAIAHAPPLTDVRLAALVRGARATLLPVVAESVGLAAVESIAVGTPVLAAAVGALPELVGAAGVLVPPGDPERLALALTASWADEPLVARLAEAARDRAAALPTWDAAAAATRGVYATVGIPATA